jgi:hypothetical protein
MSDYDHIIDHAYEDLDDNTPSEGSESDPGDREWADNDLFGDPLHQKSDTDTRFYFSNIRGTKDLDKWTHVCSAMKEISVDVAGFSEMNVDMAHEHIRTRLVQKTNKVFSQVETKLLMAYTPDKAATDKKPGGTSLLTVGGGMVSRMNSHECDRMGRWTAARYSSSEGKSLWVVSIYQVCNSTIDPKSFTAARQQQAMIIARDEDGRTLSPRQAFKQDLSDFMKKYPGDEFLIAGDFNDEVNSEDMSRFIEEMHLFDLSTYRHGTSSAPSTYIRGKKRLDFMIGTIQVADAMSYCGYDPFGARYETDHRGAWADFNTQLLFGNSTITMADKEKRIVNAREPSDVLSWVNETGKYFRDHTMSERCRVINELEEADHDLVERFDNDMVRGSLLGEKRTAEKQHRSHWSPEFAKAWATAYFYGQAWSFRRNRVKMRSTLAQINERYGLTEAIPLLRDINRKRKAAQRTLKQIRKKARELRREFLRLKAAAYAAAENKAAELILKRMQQAEDISLVYKTINRSKPASGGSIDKLEVPRVDGTPPKLCDDWRVVTIPQEIEDALLDRNRAHFGQAEGTPCTTPVMRENLGYKGDGYAAELILEGDFEEGTLDDISNLFLRHLKRKTTADKLNNEITEEQFLSKIKAWPEKTSTSPGSKLHLGLYHALVRPCGLEPKEGEAATPEYAQFVSNRDLIIACRLAIINYAMKFEYSIDRWKDVVNVMIRKDENNTRIHRLRVIHLYEADYNLMLGVKWREALHLAEDERSLNNGLYGSRAGRCAHDPVLMEIFQNEIYRMSRKSGVAFDLDAAACYDRILAALASLSSQKYGMHRKVAFVNALTLEEARFKLKTKLGHSATFYKHQADHPIHGTGQGSQNSPTIWLFICSTLFDAFEEDAHGAIFESFDKSQSIEIFMVGFVDDCSQRVNSFRDHPQPSAEVLVTMMQSDAQRWNDLLWSSASFLEATKCSYHAITTTTDANGLPMLNPARCPHALLIQVANQDEPIRIKSLSAFETHRTLGAFTSPSGNMKTQIKKSKANSQRHTDRISCCSSVKHARTYYHSFYQTSVGYTDCLTSFSAAEAHSIEKGFTMKALNQCGFNKHMERSVTWALPKRGGVGFMGRYSEQNVAKCLTTLKLLRSYSQPAILFQIMLSWLQAQSGFGSSLLGEDVITPLPHLRATWAPGIRDFLRVSGLRIKITNYRSPSAQREDDIFIMEWLLTSPNHPFSNLEICLINTCREYLQVTTLADISTPAGTRISEGAWRGPFPPVRSQDRRTHLFNTLTSPPIRAWNLWRRALLPLVEDPQSLLLRAPLGRWLVPSSEMRIVWPTVYSPSLKHLYIRNAAGAYVTHHESLPGRFTRSEVLADVLPDDAVPADTCSVVHPHPVVRLETWIPTIAREPYITPLAAPLLTAISTMEPWERSLLNEISSPLSLTALRTWYRDNKGACGTDGSVQDHKASFGWKLCNLEGFLIAQCNGPAPGWKPHSFRAEAYGYLSFVRFLLLLERDPALTGMALPVYTDSDSLLKRLAQHRKYKYETPNDTLWPDWDVTSMLFDSINLLRTKPTETWIKSHQDDDTAYEDLRLSARLNVDADELADEYIQAHPDPHNYNRALHFPNTGATIENIHGSLTGQYKSEIRDAYSWPGLRSYLTRRFQWEPNLVTRIDWEAHGTAVGANRAQSTIVVKHLIRQAPTGHIAHRNDNRQDPACLSCGADSEGNNHVMRCSGQRATTWRHKYLTSILAELNRPKLHSDPVLLDILRDGTQRWLQDTGTPLPTTQYDIRYRLLIQEQNALGWDQLFRARLSVEWRTLQDAHLARNNIHLDNCSGQSWTRTLAKHGLSWWLKVWKGRNEDRFGDSPESISLRSRAQIRRELHILYAQRPFMLPSDTYIFQATADEHMQVSDDNTLLQNWLNLNSPAIQRSIKRRKAQELAALLAAH